MRLSGDHVAPGETVYIDDAGVQYHRVAELSQDPRGGMSYSLAKLPAESPVIPRSSLPIMLEEETLP